MAGLFGQYRGPVSSLMHPSGPEPPSVYWIRRAAVVVVVVTVFALLWWLLGALRGGSGSDPAAATGPAASVEPSSAASVEPSSAASPQASVSATTSTAPVACDDSVIAVTATTDSSTYPVGSTPRLTLTIENTGSVACKRDIGPKANELSITSGGYHVWSSDDCNASDKAKVAVLKAGEKVASSITWDGRLTTPGCPNGPGAQAKAGTYRVEGRNAKVTSEPTPFSLTNKS